ncbi:alpha/beta hydrolase [Alicyclobacillus sp. SP_1]|uniref:alpha/beta hydrolase n=1 Tax=Alicyclobacillus sp. SP_1 TaxID=2942475 RepID=UPI002157605A|nr:alpha/beta hydrolase [Alicyclobacillus sp. SP_1]
MANTNRTTYYEYQACSTPTEDTLVLIHGLAADSTMWDLVWPLLAQSFNVLRYDLPEHGKSDPAPSTQDLTWPYLIDDLHCLAEALKIGRFHVVAHGFGGTLALEYARAYPEAVVTLSIISLHAAVYFKARPEVYDGLRAFIRGHKNAGPIGAHLAQMYCSPSMDAWAGRLYNMADAVSADSWIHFLDLIANTPTVDLIKESSTPIFMLFGRSDPLTPYEGLNHLLTHDLAGKRTLLVPNASNCLHIEAPELTASAVHDYIKQVTNQQTNGSNPLVELIHDLCDPLGVTDGGSGTIELNCLGGFHVKVNGVSILKGWNQRFAKEILIYIALHGSAARDELIDLLWNNAELTQARTQLRVALSHLRKLLKVGGMDADLLVADHAHVRLAGTVTCDVLDVKRAIGQASALEGEERALAIERIFDGLPVPPLFSGIYHDSVLSYWYGIENKLQELSRWCLDYYECHGVGKEAARFKKTVSRFLPGYESEASGDA